MPSAARPGRAKRYSRSHNAVIWNRPAYGLMDIEAHSLPRAVTDLCGIARSDLVSLPYGLGSELNQLGRIRHCLNLNVGLSKAAYRQLVVALVTEAMMVQPRYRSAALLRGRRGFYREQSLGRRHNRPGRR